MRDADFDGNEQEQTPEPGGKIEPSILPGSGVAVKSVRRETFVSFDRQAVSLLTARGEAAHLIL